MGIGKADNFAIVLVLSVIFSFTKRLLHFSAPKSTSATTLEKESGFLLESSTVIQFRQGVLQGDWAKVDDLLPSLQLKDNAHTIELKFLLRRQKYLELLEDRDLKKAIHVLRNELAPLQFSTEQLHELSRWVTQKCNSPPVP